MFISGLEAAGTGLTASVFTPWTPVSKTQCVRVMYWLHGRTAGSLSIYRQYEHEARERIHCHAGNNV